MKVAMALDGPTMDEDVRMALAAASDASEPVLRMHPQFPCHNAYGQVDHQPPSPKPGMHRRAAKENGDGKKQIEVRGKQQREIETKREENLLLKRRVLEEKPQRIDGKHSQRCGTCKMGSPP